MSQERPDQFVAESCGKSIPGNHLGCLSGVCHPPAEAGGRDLAYLTSTASPYLSQAGGGWGRGQPSPARKDPDNEVIMS